MINNDNFIIKEIPKFHAISQRYDRVTFWKEQKRNAIEGYWSSGKWMPGTLYYYINFHTIRFEDVGSASRKIGRPWLRDIEWDKAYVYEEAMGFSGFSEDTKYTCDRKYGPEKEKALKFGWITEEELKTKEYINAREYLRKIHDRNLGKPLYNNQSKNVLDLEARGGGKSYWSSALILHNFLFDGASDYDSYLENKKNNSPLTSDTVVGAIESKYSDDLLKKVRLAIEHLPDKQIINGEIFPSPLHVSYTGSLASGKTLSSYLGSVINHRTFADDPLAANGTRPNRAFLEECFAMGTKVRMADLTTKNIEDIVVGDSVLGADGKPKLVGRTVSGKDIMYKVSQKRGIDYVVNSQHLLYLEQRCKVSDIKDDGIKLIHAEDFNLLGKYRSRTTYGKTSGCISLERSKRDILRIDPYYLGLWLGDGYEASQAIVLNKNLDVEILDFIKEYTKKLKLRLKLTPTCEESNYEMTIATPTKKHGRTNVLRSALRYYGILGEKNIPDSYQRASENQRLELLAGIIDTDGHLNINNTGAAKSYEICVHKRKKLAYDIAFLARSLGFDVNIKESKISIGYNKKVIPERDKYRISIKGEIWRIPCKVERKKVKQWDKVNAINSTPIVVSCVGEGEYFGITIVANKPEDRLFLLEDNTIVHNCGFMNNVVEVLGALESTQASADYKNLVIYMLGTGGLSTHGAVTHTKEIFNNPEEFNCLAFEDIWENKGKIGYFLPGTHTINKFKKGPNMITDEEKAKMYIEEEIEKAKNSGNRRKYMAAIINMPLKPSDIFLTTEGNFFPIEDLRERLGEIEGNKKLLEASWKVQFFIKDGRVDWSLSPKPVLREYPHRRGDILDTAIELYELPKLDASDKPPFGRYLASLDPVDNDGGDDVDHSLMSGFILDSWTDKIVVEYTVRTKLIEEAYEQWRRCLIYYNALCNYERNLKGFYSHMKNTNSLHLLADEPEILKEKGLSKGAGTGNQLKGVHATVPIINWGLELILSWLNQNAYVGNEEEDIITNLQTIKNPALLQELIAYNSEVNADRVSALIYLMILREDRYNISKNSVNKSIHTVTSNKFWDKAYKTSKSKFYISNK